MKWIKLFIVSLFLIFLINEISSLYDKFFGEPPKEIIKIVKTEVPKEVIKIKKEKVEVPVVKYVPVEKIKKVYIEKNKEDETPALPEDKNKVVTVVKEFKVKEPSNVITTAVLDVKTGESDILVKTSPIKKPFFLGHFKFRNDPAFLYGEYSLRDISIGIEKDLELNRLGFGVYGEVQQEKDFTGQNFNVDFNAGIRAKLYLGKKK